MPRYDTAWDHERARKASGHSTASDGSHAAVFTPAPPVPAIPSRLLSNGYAAATPGYGSNGRPDSASGNIALSISTERPALIQPVSSQDVQQYSRPVRSSKAYSEASRLSRASSSAMQDGTRRTLASLYLVAGLPKDPSNWSMAEMDVEPAHLDNAVPRWFKAEVLGSMISGGGEGAMEALDGTTAKQSRKGRVDTLRSGRGRSAKPDMVTIDEQPTLSKEEIAKIQAKAIKVGCSRSYTVS